MKGKNRTRHILATNVRTIRKEKGLTQEKLAELADVSNTYIANIECGKTWVSDTTLEKIADALETSVYDLFIPEQNDETEITKNPKTVINKILAVKEKQLNEEIKTLVKNTIKEIKDEINIMS